MGLRFRKSVKLGPGIRVNLNQKSISATLGPRGFSTSITKSGIYQNVGLPGTGLSYRARIGGGKPKTGKRGASSSHAPLTGQPIPQAIREWQAYTGKRNPGAEFQVDERGEIRFWDEDGREIDDPELISIIKRTPQYKAQLPLLREEQRGVMAELAEDLERESIAFTRIHTLSPVVLEPHYYIARLEMLQPAHYEPQRYGVPAPTPAEIQAQLFDEAARSVRGVPWKRSKLREQYVSERLQSRLEEATLRWQAERSSFENAEISRAAWRNAQYATEYEQVRASLEKSLVGDADYIEDAAEQWMASVDLPIEISTQLEYRPYDKCLMVDLDLPEIEDLPTETALQLSNGDLRIKEKTQKALRLEYAECVFGLAIFVAANLFNISPEIQDVTISGYTQRRDKIGELTDDYILSVRFKRDHFYGVDYESLDPETFCLSFENRCNVATTKVFKTIVPFV